MPPSMMPTTSTCSMVSMRMGTRIAPVSFGELLFAWRILQRDDGGACLGWEYRRLLARLPLDHGRQGARVLELVIEFDAESRWIRVGWLVHLGCSRPHLFHIGRAGRLDCFEQNFHSGICRQALRCDRLAVVRLAVGVQIRARPGAEFLRDIWARVGDNKYAFEEIG